MTGLNELNRFVKTITDHRSPFGLAELIKNIKVALMLDIMAATMNNSPVDTGRTKANWWITADGNPSRDMLPNHFDHTQTAQVNKNELMTVKTDSYKPIWMVNNVHYAILLETGTAWYGFSPKAPRGMLLFSLLGGRLTDGRQVRGVLHSWARTRI